MLSSADFWQYFGVLSALVAAAFGLPIPEEIPIATGGVLVSQAWGTDSGLVWWVMIPLCIFGVVASDVILYGIGRRWGSRLLKSSWVQRRVLPPDRFQKIEKNFEQYGIRILLIARLIPGIRTPVFISAGIVRLPFRRFLLADAIYAIPGVTIIFTLAYWLTDSFMFLIKKLDTYRELLLVAVISFIAGFIVANFIRRPVSTGSPEDLPVLGNPVVKVGHPQGVQIPPDVPKPPEVGGPSSVVPVT